MPANISAGSGIKVIVKGRVARSIVAAAKSTAKDTVTLFRTYGVTIPGAIITLCEKSSVLEQILVEKRLETPKEAKLYSKYCGITYTNDAFINIETVEASGESVNRTVSHELMHVAQYVLMKRINYYKLAHGWLIEGTAELVEQIMSTKTPQALSDPFLAGDIARGDALRLLNIKLTEIATWRKFQRACNKLNIYALAHAAALRLSLRESNKPDLAPFFKYFALFAKAPRNKNKNFSLAFGITHKAFDKEFQKYLAATLGN